MGAFLINRESENSLINSEKIICEYEKLLAEKEAVILEQSDIIKQQKDYIYKLLSEVESTSPKFAFKLGFAKLMNIVF